MISDELAELMEELTFDEISAKALEDHQAAGGAGLSEAEQRAIQERAREMINQTRAGGTAGGPLEGLQDMHNLSLSIGLPVPRVLFAEALKATAANEARKKAWRKKLQKMAKVTETGCIQVELEGGKVREKTTVYLVLDRCPPDHNLTAQLDKIYALVPESRKPEILRHLSALVQLGRMAYNQMLAKVAPTLKEISDKLTRGGDAFGTLCIDPANTTFYLDSVPACRVGIFVRLGSEVEK